MDMDTFNHIEPGNETYIIVFCALLVSWIFVFMALRNSVKSVGKMTRVTATLPFILITAFVARAVTLPGAYSGLQYLFTPDWSVLRSGEVWANAAVQVLLSLNIGLGSSITFSSYNKFRNNFTTDVWIISFVSCMSTLLAVLMVFSSIGNIVHELGINIENVNFRGVDLAFVVYPRILLRLPQRHIWTAIYFLLLLLLSLD
ncbi:Sodium- and chloride-dependent glycine transporter 2, partial [Armadillidium nasatum]